MDLSWEQRHVPNDEFLILERALWERGGVREVRGKEWGGLVFDVDLFQGLDVFWDEGNWDHNQIFHAPRSHFRNLLISVGPQPFHRTNTTLEGKLTIDWVRVCVIWRDWLLAWRQIDQTKEAEEGAATWKLKSCNLSIWLVHNVLESLGDQESALFNVALVRVTRSNVAHRNSMSTNSHMEGKRRSMRIQ
jgi:hypothetical protein